VKVKVLYFASLREKLGTGAEELDLPAGVASVDALRAHLRARGGAWAEALAEGRLLRAAVNQDMADGAAAVKAGDEVAFFPPVTGG
jgi:molybdopterin synthase sulfur carrier subunit